MTRYVSILNLLFILLQVSLMSAFAQNESWVMYQLPGNFPIAFHQATGETGMIFVDDTSHNVHAFDINDGQWKTYISLTNAT